MTTYPRKFREFLDSIKSKRPKTVVQHILKHGFITTKELEEIYGYKHPPRAIRDARELGVPITSYTIQDEDGKHIGAYKFGDISNAGIKVSKSAGRTGLSKALKQALVEKYGSRCFIYLEEMDSSTLQIDHRVPYEIGGEADTTVVDNFMLLCPSANRAKSWSCEHCENWIKKDTSFCLRCFWAHPEEYEHIAGKEARAINILFTGNEIDDYNRLIALSGETSAQETIKNILHEYLSRNFQG